MIDLATHGIASFRTGNLRGGRGPEPASWDYWVFFMVLPLIYALWGAAVGIGPTRTMSFGGGFAYNSTHIAAAWWGNGLACLAVVRLLRGYRPPLWRVLLVGHALAWVPLYIFYLYHHDYFSEHFRTLLPDPNRPEVGLSGTYLLHTLRYSTVPFLVIWFGAIYGYLLLTGVQFFVPAESRAVPRRKTAVTPGFMKGSRLGSDASVFAIKAEEHYIRIWSTEGTDLVRYRFADAVTEVAGRNGGQIHRSWWIDLDHAASWRNRGRALEITLRNGLQVPVSLAYKAQVLGRLMRLLPPRQPAQSDPDATS
jgi:hypothetical protein